MLTQELWWEISVLIKVSIVVPFLVGSILVNKMGDSDWFKSQDWSFGRVVDTKQIKTYIAFSEIYWFNGGDLDIYAGGESPSYRYSGLPVARPGLRSRLHRVIYLEVILLQV